MHRIVHLDLKGAPWKVPYLEKVLLKAKQWGATGILLEWEDTFPFTGELADIGSERNAGGDNLYNREEVLYIMHFAKDIGLEVIQLIQTISHLEYVLKHPAYRALREAPKSPAVLCPSKADSLRLLRGMLLQILEAQPDARYLHIGADEVWHIATCPDCKLRAEQSLHKVPSLYLDHIKYLATFIKELRPDLTVLIWDDMLRSISVDSLNAYNLGDLVQPVLWHYNPIEHFQIDPMLWNSYRQVFPTVWAGSAFKGANGSCQIVSPVSRYASNHAAWVKEINKYKGVVHFSGVILTGWSRYDHYATLCELLPVSLPSLGTCLRVLAKGEFENYESLISETLPLEEWPGMELARCLHSFVIQRDRCYAFIHGDLIATWLNPWQLENNYTNPVQIEGIAINAQHLLKDLTALQNELSSNLTLLTGNRSTNECIESLVTPLTRRLLQISDIATARVEADAGVLPVK